VTKVATVSLHGNTFEVDAALVGSRVEIVFDPFAMEAVEVRFQGRPMAKGSRWLSAATPTPGRAEAAPLPRPPASTTSACWRAAVTPSWPGHQLRPIDTAGAGEPESTTDQKSAHTNETEEI